MLYIAFLLIISKEMVFRESTPNGEISCVQRHVVKALPHFPWSCKNVYVYRFLLQFEKKL